MLVKILQALIFFCCTTASAAHEDAVQALTAATFEHATQAASGQTTGFWLVYFGKENDSVDQQLFNAFAEQQREDVPWIIHAFVNIDTSPEVANRFKISTSPSFILFRNRRLYRFDKKRSAKVTPALIAELAAFSKSGWSKVEAEQVPHESRRTFSVKAMMLIIGGSSIAAVLLAVVGDHVLQYRNARALDKGKVQ